LHSAEAEKTQQLCIHLQLAAGGQECCIRKAILIFIIISVAARRIRRNR
jgi:hypothetical protein